MSTAQTTSSATNNTVVNEPFKILISEIQTGGTDDPGDEFIELYNPDSEPRNFSEWSLQYISGGSTSFEQVKKKNFNEGAAIPAHGYYLITRGLSGAGDDGYTGGTAADFSERTISLSGSATGGIVFIVKNQEALTGLDDPDIVDAVGYGAENNFLNGFSSAPAPGKGESIERRALAVLNDHNFPSQECVSALPSHTGEYRGNGCDTDIYKNDFETRHIPDPQNSNSVREPVESEPNEVVPEEVVNEADADSGNTSSSSDGAASSSVKFVLSYDSSTLHIAADWREIKLERDPESALNYRLLEFSAGTTTLIFESSSTPWTSWQITDIGRTYNFGLVEDRDGSDSVVATSSISVPGILENNQVYFYRDPRNELKRYDIDFFYDAIQFIPPVWSTLIGGPAWQGIVFYLNHDPDNAPGVLNTQNNFTPENMGNVMNVGVNGGTAKNSLLFGLSPEVVGPFGGGLRQQVFLLPQEDGHLPLSLGASSDSLTLGTNDYFTMAVYDFSGSGGGYQSLTLAARDYTRHYFSGVLPEEKAPDAPPDLTAEFNQSRMEITLSWTSSTDPDTPDGELSYEIGFSTSSASSITNWVSAGNPPYIMRSAPIAMEWGNEYVFGVRAKDPFGNTSEVRTITWNFPEGFVPLPLQLNHSEMVGDPRYGGGQKITMMSDEQISSIYFWGENDGGQWCCAASRLEVHEDNSGTPGSIIATSSVFELDRFNRNGELQYNFDGLSLEISKSYWLIPVQTQWNPTRIYGSTRNPYLQGSWADSWSDAYFRMTRKEPTAQ
ncbi:MAG: lamin tail domain-containing protein [Candidatus Liptonbacteria bacterium]